MRDLYEEAIVEGSAEWAKQTGELLPAGPPDTGPSTPEYWIARYAARAATEAVLVEAMNVGVTDEQWEALRAKAAEVAYD